MCENSGNAGQINNTDVTYKMHSHSGSWCDYETKLGRVNIQIQKMNNPKAEYVKIKMTLKLKMNIQLNV